jgi:single stranded DNA-binding protein
MASVNKVILIGNLGKDPEVRTTPQGTSLARFSIATTTTWKDASGAKQERTEWHDIVAWERLAQICGEYLHKGKMVYVEGSLQTRSWEDQNGQKRYKTEVRQTTSSCCPPGCRPRRRRRPAEPPQRVRVAKPRPTKTTYLFNAAALPPRSRQSTVDSWRPSVIRATRCHPERSEGSRGREAPVSAVPPAGSRLLRSAMSAMRSERGRLGRASAERRRLRWRA